MKAMIFAAGLGTRLQPLTNDKPKALVEIEGVTLLEIVIRRLMDFGVQDIIVNVHHFADLIESFLASKQYFGINIAISDERELLLDTGGGLKKASWFFEDGAPFLVHNVDIISNLNLHDLYQAHINSGALVTLAVSQRKTSRVLQFNNKHLLCAWKNLLTGAVRWARKTSETLQTCSFSGIHVIDPKIFPLIREEGKFSIIDVYLNLGATQDIGAYFHDQSMWMDVGKHESLEKASLLLQQIEMQA